MSARIPRTCSIALTLALVAACSSNQPHQSMHPQSAPAPAAAHAADSKSVTVNVQDDSSVWKRSPHMHAFYDMTVTTFAHGTNIDVDAYEAKCFDIFREFARANHANEQAMLDHLKLIPRQVVGIVKENPSVLKSYDSFWVAMVGPE